MIRLSVFGALIIAMILGFSGSSQVRSNQIYLTDNWEANSRPSVSLGEAQCCRVRLMEVGEFHEDEVDAISGETWLGLFKLGKSFEFSPVTINVKTVFDQISDSEGEKTGKRVTVSSKNKTVFLIKGAINLQKKEVPTLFAGNENIHGKYKRGFQFAEKHYTLRIVGGERGEETLTKGAKLILSVGGNEQTIVELPEGGDDPSWSIYWVGDMDGDGELDFYLNVSKHYNVIDRRLFLSSRAIDGQLVSEIAKFRTVGC